MNDKINHLFAGAVVALVVGFIPYLATGHLGDCLWAAVSSGVIAAVIKEWCDYRTDGNVWDWWDFGCTVIGAVLVALFIVGLHYGKG